MDYKTVKRSSTRELVIKQILESIDSGRLKPGDQLPTEFQLSEMFGVGRSTIREATSTLSTLGYLKSIQGKGCFVREDLAPGDASGFTVYDSQAATHIIDLVEVREILECNAVRLASQRADSEDITRIQKACSNMKRTMMDLDRFTEHDFEFHMAIARATGNRMILELMKRIVEKVHKEYERFKPTALFKRDEAFFTAEQITDAIKQGDAQRAANLMKAHLNLVTTEIKHKIQDAK